MKGSEQSYRNFLSMYPDSQYREDALWAIARESRDVRDYEKYLDEFKHGKYSGECTWLIAKEINTVELYEQVAELIPARFQDKLKSNLSRLYEEMLESQLASIGRAIVDKCFLGGQNIDCYAKNITRVGKDIFKADVRIDWNGAIFRSNIHDTKGNLLFNADTREYYYSNDSETCYPGMAIELKNTTSHTVQLWLAYYSPMDSDKLLSDGIWEIPPGKYMTFSSNGFKVSTSRRGFFYYAKSKDGSREWAGDNRIEVNGQTRNMRVHNMKQEDNELCVVLR